MNRVTVQVTGSPEAISCMVEAAMKNDHVVSVMVQRRYPEPWFERRGKLTPDEAADLEAGTYGVRRYSPGGFVGLTPCEKVIRR